MTILQPRFLFIFLIAVSASIVFGKSHPDKSEFKTTIREGVSVNRAKALSESASILALKTKVATLSVPRTKFEQIGYTAPAQGAAGQIGSAQTPLDIVKKGSVGLLSAQVGSVLIPSYNSVVTFSPANDVLDRLNTTAGSGTTYVSDLAYGELRPLPSTDPSVSSLSEIFKQKYLVAGPDLEWSEGNIGMAAFAAHKDIPSYAGLKYWLIKGPHSDGDRYNMPSDTFIQFGPDKKLRLENVYRKGNLSISDIKSPYSKIFEGTDSPIKDKYSVVNLAGVPTGIGSNKDDWYFLTAGGGNIDMTITVSGIAYPIKGASVMLKSNIGGSYRALAMPVYNKDTEPDFGLGVTLVNDSTWTKENRGPTEWVMDLGADEVASVGGQIVNGGLWGKMTSTLDVYVWGRNQRAYCKPGAVLGIDTRQGKTIRNTLQAPDGWCMGTEPFTAGSGGSRNTFFQWPGDGVDGVGRVNLDPYLMPSISLSIGSIKISSDLTMFPAAFRGIDLGLSLWNGKIQYRFKAKRIKGGPCRNSDCDYGMFVVQPIGGMKFPAELPWRMPKIRGTADGSFDGTSGVNRVFEVSARGGDAAFMPGGQTAYGTTLWRLSDIYPHSILARCAGRGDPEAVSKLKDFFNETVPAYNFFDYSTAGKNGGALESEPINGMEYGATAKLRHKESGNYLCVSKATLPGNTTTFYLTCTPDSASAGKFMVTPGLGLAARVDGTKVQTGEPIRLVDTVTGRTVCAVDVPPVVSQNFGLSSLDDLSSGNALLKQYDIPAVAYAGQPPATTATIPPSNWIPYVQQVQSGSTDASTKYGFIFQNHAYGGYLSSVNGYVFQAPGSSGEWVQEVTVFDSGSNQTYKDVGDFGVWMVEDYTPAPSTWDEMASAGFGAPLTLIDGSQVNLVSVASGTSGFLYGVDGSGNAVKIDLIKQTKEQLATGVKQIAVGSDESIVMLKLDGSIVLRPVSGADMIIPGCMGRSVGIGNASQLTAVSVDGGVNGHLMVNQGQQLLASQANALCSDITDDGFVFGVLNAGSTVSPSAGPALPDARVTSPVVTSATRSQIVIGQQGNPAPWATVNLTSVPAVSERIVDISVGSSRFIILRGEDGGLFRLTDDAGSTVFADPVTKLLAQTNNILQSNTSWTQMKSKDGRTIRVADAAVSADGLLVALAGQVTQNFEFQVFVQPLASWPNESVLFNLKMETGSTSATSTASPQYSDVLVADNNHGYLEMFTLRSGEKISTQATGSVAEFCMVSADGYVTLQTKSGQNMKAANSAIGLKANDQLQNKNMMTGKNNGGTILAAGVPLDTTLLNNELAVGFGGEKFKMYGDKDAVLEKFIFYPVTPQPDDGSGRIRFILQSKATGGFLHYDPSSNSVVSLTKDANNKAQPLPKSAATTFVAFPLAQVNLKLQQALVGKNPRDAMSVFEAAWIDEATFGGDPSVYFAQLLHWLQGVRISPALWLDFSQTVGDWTDPVTQLKKSVTASARLQYLVSDASLLANSAIGGLFADAANPGKARNLTSSTAPLDMLVVNIRKDGSDSQMPSDLGLLKNVQDGSIVALKSEWGIDASGKLTKSKANMVSQFYVGVDAATGQICLQNTTSIDSGVQFNMKVVPSPLAGQRNVDEGHDAADIQRWMFQDSAGTDATVKRLYVPTISSDVVMDSDDVALDKYTLQWGTLKDVNPSTLLPAYFDVQATPNNQAIVLLQSSSCSGFWGLGKSVVVGGVEQSLLKEGLPILLNTGLIDTSVDLKIRAQGAVLGSDNSSYVPTPNVVGDAAKFEIVIITPVLQQLSGAFKKATFADQVSEFLVVSSRLEKASDVNTFCDAVSAFITKKARGKQADWNAYAGDRASRDKLTQCVANIKKTFADDYGKADSLTKASITNLEKVIDVSRVPMFGSTETRAQIIADLTAIISSFDQRGALDAFVTSGGSKDFMRKLQIAVADWSASMSVSVADESAQQDGAALEGIITNYKTALGMSLNKADAALLDGFVATLTATGAIGTVNPVDVLQNIVALNTANGVITFGSDAKCSFLTKLWELYKASTLDPDAGVMPLDASGNIASRGVVFGLSPAQINQLTGILQAVCVAPAGVTTVGGPFFADDGDQAIREGDWKWTTQPFGSLTNTEIVNQLAALFTVPTLVDFVTTYLQYFTTQQDALVQLATSSDPKDLAQAARFSARLLGLAEQWNGWKKGATPRQQRQELNQFKVLIRGIKSFVQTNSDLKARQAKLLTQIQSAIDQLS